MTWLEKLRLKVLWSFIVVLSNKQMLSIKKAYTCQYNIEKYLQLQSDPTLRWKNI